MQRLHSSEGKQPGAPAAQQTIILNSDEDTLATLQSKRRPCLQGDRQGFTWPEGPTGLWQVWAWRSWLQGVRRQGGCVLVRLLGPAQD